MRRLLSLAALTAGLVLAMTGVALAADVTIEDDGLSPTRVVVDVREPIVWTNNTDEAVSLIGENPGWESGEIAPGATFSIEITQAGTYSYGSENGQQLRGQIVVREGGGGNGSDDEGDEDPDVAEQDEEDEADAEDDEEVVDPDDEALPTTGIGAMVPGSLSVLLVVLGAGLLLVTHPERALRR